MISRRILAAVALLCAFAGPAFAQSTKAQLNTQIGVNFPDNNSNQITPQNLRTVTSGIVNSVMPTAPVVSGHFPAFDGVTGLLKDSGTGIASLPLSVLDYGADPTGITDSRGAIVAADAAAASLGKAVYFPAGTYKISSSIIVSIAAYWYGENNSTTVLESSTSACNILSLSNGFVTLRNFQFKGAVACVSGTAVDVASSAMQFSNLYFNGTWEAMKFETAVSTVLADYISVTSSPNNSTAGLVFNGCLQCVFNNTIMVAGTGSPAAHVALNNLGDVTFNDSSFIGATNNVVVQPGNGQIVASTTFNGGGLDHATSSNLFAVPTGTGQWLRSQFNNVGISSAGVANVNYSPGTSAVIDGITYTSCTFFGLSSSPFNLAFAGTTASILNQQFNGGAVAGGNVSAVGFTIAGIGNISISNMKIGTFGGFAGIATGAGISGTNGVIALDNNDFTGSTAPLSISGTNTSITAKSNINLGDTEPETTLASATTTSLGSSANEHIAISGSTTITSFGAKANADYIVRYTGSVPVTYNGTSLILLGGTSRTMAAGDVAEYQSDASGNWRETKYFAAAVAPPQIAFGTAAFQNTGTSGANVPFLNGANTWSGAQTHSGQIISTFGTPTIASGACGTGTNGTISGSNQSGVITIGATSTTTCTVSFSTTITAPGACLIFPGNATAAATGTTVARVGTPSTSAWVITGSALASTVYSYICL